eukprot:TRINITY_DN4488_c1_g1_i1.p1 TRINITY_DN4488_c1_g1~~TRINITY_DN4488_c1_g1_i1.p1  ORF type:complete len:257 (-),score=-8.74 TRINITY_DN4488_c1_g1_i1:557-1252(-)
MIGKMSVCVVLKYSMFCKHKYSTAHNICGNYFGIFSSKNSVQTRIQTIFFFCKHTNLYCVQDFSKETQICLFFYNKKMYHLYYSIIVHIFNVSGVLTSQIIAINYVIIFLVLLAKQFPNQVFKPQSTPSTLGKFRYIEHWGFFVLFANKKPLIRFSKHPKVILRIGSVNQLNQNLRKIFQFNFVANESRNEFLSVYNFVKIRLSFFSSQTFKVFLPQKTLKNRVFKCDKQI